eukprot:TRINITY_DN18682_c0_g2_i4.p4 TRINITY_DN18682_c0_g2~~TRINITY_DN18682_c0_g2_i4.p4  ORF type:complete len:217 (+),score=-1.19 TRINITY_DN18682_c0_g2_i4:144-794(+)
MLLLLQGPIALFCRASNQFLNMQKSKILVSREGPYANLKEFQGIKIFYCVKYLGLYISFDQSEQINAQLKMIQSRLEFRCTWWSRVPLTYFERLQITNTFLLPLLSQTDFAILPKQDQRKPIVNMLQAFQYNGTFSIKGLQGRSPSLQTCCRPSMLGGLQEVHVDILWQAFSCIIQNYYGQSHRYYIQFKIGLSLGQLVNKKDIVINHRYIRPFQN